MTDLRQQLLCRVKNRAHHAVIAHARDANGKVVQFVWSAYGDGRSLYEVVREGHSLARGPRVQEAVDLYVMELAGVAMNDTTDGKWQDCQEILLPRSLSAMAALECEVAMMSEDEVSKHLEQHRQYAGVKSNAKIHP